MRVCAEKEIVTPYLWKAGVLIGYARAGIFSFLFSLLTANGDAFATVAAPSGNASGVTLGAGPVANGVGVAQAPMLKSINQVEGTERGAETLIQVQGTGYCTFSIGRATSAPRIFASSAATPFPMKIVMTGAPLGTHLWIAKGKGSCSGTAITSFSVNG